MSLIVQKYGGSSVADAKKIQNIAEIVTDTYENGNKVVVVISAQGDTTDDFITKSNELNLEPSKRELDVLLSAGEQISMALLAMAIEKLGYPVVTLTGWQAGIRTSSTNGDARIEKIDAERLKRELDKNKIVIVAGFQGVDKSENITTLGRGGSDTTAVAIAAELNADLCQIYTDVDGVYTADPRVVKDARKLDEITFDEILELASMGAQVLHNRSVELGKKHGVNMEVLSSFTRGNGTKVKEVTDMEMTNISGVAKDSNISRITVISIPAMPGIAFKLFSILAKENIVVDTILQPSAKDGIKDVTFTVKRVDSDRTIELLRSKQSVLKFQDVTACNHLSKVSVVGAGMVSNGGIASSMFEALYDMNINILMIAATEIKISVLIEEEDADSAVRAIHNKFFG